MSAAARAVAAKKAHEKKRTRHANTGRPGSKAINRVYEVDDVTEDDVQRIGGDEGARHVMNKWTDDGTLQSNYKHHDDETDSDDDDLDLLEQAILEDEIGCGEQFKCCGRKREAKCCTNAHKRRPYCMDMDGAREGKQAKEPRNDGTSAYRLNLFFLRVVNHQLFEALVLIAILIVTFLIGAGTYTTQSNVLSAIETAVQAWFVTEIVLKMGARGPTYYFCQYWNIFDFSIVTVTLLPTSLFGSGGGSESVAILRLLRLLRMAKLMKVDAVEAIISGLSKGMKSLFYIMLLLFLVFYVFAILGMMLFGQNDPMHFRNLHDALLTLFRISTLEDWTDIMYLNMFGCGYTGYEYPAFSHPGATGTYDDPQWAQLIENCTNTYDACLSDEWIEFALGTGITNLGSPIDTYPCLHPVPNGWVSASFFVIFVVISALVMLSLFIGLVSSEIESEQSRIKEEKSKAKKKEASKKNRAKDGVGRSSSSLKGLVGVPKKTAAQRFATGAKKWFDEDDLRTCRKSVFSEENLRNSVHLQNAQWVRQLTDHAVTQGVILLAILVAAVAAGAETQDDGESQALTDLIEKVEVVIVIIFSVEVVALVFAEGTKPWYYFREKMNCFDFTIVVVCLVSMALSGDQAGSAVQGLRMLRLLRLLKLLDEIPELKQIVVGLQSGLSSIFFITCIMVLVYYLYAVVGLMMFQDNDPHHFQDLHNAMISLFRASTFEDWTDIMYINYLGCDKWGYADPLPDNNDPTNELTCTDSNGGSSGAIVYFLSFIVINAFIVLSLFIGVVTSSMIDARSEALRKTLEKQLREQLEKQFPVWLAFDKEGNERRERFKRTFNDIDEDGSGYINLDELSDWLTDQKVPWSRERRVDLLDGLVVPRDDPVIKEELNLSQFIRLNKATELGMTPKELQHDIAITEGRLLIGMHWVPEHPKLMLMEVRVIECEGLTQMDKFLCFTGENDPYVSITVKGESKNTDTIDGGGANPTWNIDSQDGFLLPFEFCELPDEIWVRAYDEDEASADDLIGIGKINLKGKPCDRQWFLDDHWVQLYETYEEKDGKPTGKQSGRVRVKVNFDPVETPQAQKRRAPRKAKTVANLERQLTRKSSVDEEEQVGLFEFTIKEGKNLTPQDAFGDNDVYVVTTIGVSKSDLVKDSEGKLAAITSNRPKCPTQLEATRMAEDSDEEDELEDPYTWRSETVDAGGSDPKWFAGGERKSWDIVAPPRWVMIRSMDEDLDDDDHIGTGLVDINAFFKAKFETIQTILAENEEIDISEEAMLEEKAHEQFKTRYGCSLDDLISGKVEWHCEEWVDVKRETPDSIVDSGCEQSEHNPELVQTAKTIRERHMNDQRLLCHLLNGGTMEDAIMPTPSKPPGNLPMDAPADSNEGLSSLEAEVDASPLDVVKEDRNEFGNDVEDGGSPPSAAVSTPGGNELNPGERPGEKLLP